MLIRHVYRRNLAGKGFGLSQEILLLRKTKMYNSIEGGLITREPV